ncbi:hypothetical protein BGW38_010500, partial [Lunasporangiospora selenospora]
PQVNPSLAFLNSFDVSAAELPQSDEIPQSGEIEESTFTILSRSTDLKYDRKPQTVIACKICDVPLYLAKDRNCLEDFHSQ